MPGGEKDEKLPPSTSARSRDADLIPAIVLGAIFGLFVIILVTSLYCFCRRKKRCRGKKNGRSPPHSETNGASKKHALVECNGTGNTIDAKFNADSPRRFHVSTCPALELGKSTNNNNNGKSKRQTDDVFYLMEASSKEKLICTCNKKYFTLDERDHPKKNTKKKVLYKSTSSPSILQASENEESSPVDTTGLLADEDFDVSELEDDVTELDSSRIPQLERSAFKDSYDPFCRSDSGDVSFKDVANLRPSALEKPALESSVSKDADVSSSGTVESEPSGAPKITKEPHRDSKSSDSKSSGYGEGVAQNTSSNHFENFNPITRFVPLTSTRSDIGYYSDASSRLSPLEFMNNSKYQQAQRNKHSLPGHNTQYFSEDEAMLHGTLHRPLKPPSYTQAIVDIERMSEKSEKTDSEKSFDHLLEMERQLGVRLCDSDDSDLTTKSLMTSRYRHSIPRNYFSDTGYTSDIGSWKDKYTNREKTLRCNQLLEEFKSSRKSGSEQTLVEAAAIPPPLTRPYSLVDNIIPEESPILKRKDSCSSTYNEWLV